MQKNILKSLKIFKKLTLVAVLAAIFLAGAASPASASVQIRSGRLDYQEDLIELSQGVTIFWKDYEITSERGEIDRPNSIAHLYENIEVLFERGHINSKNLTIYLDEDELVFTEEVYLNYQREEDDEPLELTSSKLVYDSETGGFELEEPLEINQPNRKIKAGAGSFSEEEEVFNFRSGVEITEEDGDTITSDTARLDLSEGDIFTAEGDVEIELDL
ncbi:MAG: LPS export ABC transporter periplasmic protein LptC [Bacillota bacterium]